ncbi:MAG: lysophospholipid acyltransferase family protein, partial [Planctomycetota bacterium]
MTNSPDEQKTNQEESPGEVTPPEQSASHEPATKAKASPRDERAGKKRGRKESGRKAPLKRSFVKRAFYFLVRLFSQYLGVFLFNARCYGRENIPGAGRGLILSSHQSHFDPVLIGITFNERLNYLARRTLFNNKIFGTIISLLDAIELDRDRSGLAGLKETLQRLKRGEKVLIFPEGTRSSDGKLAKLKPGFIAVAKRSKVPLIPVAITGAFEALPRGAKLPLRHPMRVVVGKVIEYEEFGHLEDDELLQLIQQRLEDCDR